MLFDISCLCLCCSLFDDRGHKSSLTFTGSDLIHHNKYDIKLSYHRSCKEYNKESIICTVKVEKIIISVFSVPMPDRWKTFKIFKYEYNFTITIETMIYESLFLVIKCLSNCFQVFNCILLLRIEIESRILVQSCKQ